ncbi:hypothetical protein RclHR1_05650001 [Rhizophagus clarus]|uniref:Uncharacterized protein n=1 Tax=Rhizophagus clarus TaxID=94130 RepID=A0A2Z6RU73_9GLOM|nr:hypothetical protein RclHR1_05650001 [Rhizophagus clarus]
MKKGFLISKPAQKIAKTSSTTKVTPTTALKSIPSNRFHDVIADFMFILINRSLVFLLSSIIPLDPEALELFLLTHDDKRRSAKKKARKKKQKLQLQTPSGLDERKVPTFSKESPEYTPSKPSGSRMVTFNQSTLSSPSTPYKLQLKRDSKPQSTPIDNGKKLKQKETDNTLKNGNVIITGYIPQDQEQAQLLDLVVYDIPVKWDNYTLLVNLGRWGKVISVSTRVHKKYLSARVKLIPDHEYLKYYNRGDWTVNLGGIPI